MNRRTHVLAFLVALVAGVAVAQNVDNFVRHMKGGWQSGTYGVRSSTHKVTNALAGSIDYDFASATIVCNDSPAITVTGAAVGDPCFVGLATPTGGTFTANSNFTCYVSEANTVLVRHCPAGTAANPADAGYNVRIISNQ